MSYGRPKDWVEMRHLASEYGLTLRHYQEEKPHLFELVVVRTFVGGESILTAMTHEDVEGNGKLSNNKTLEQTILDNAVRSKFYEYLVLCHNNRFESNYQLPSGL
ncbi:hypothetical protein [uncultured Psychrobacter sp.]|uniref:hypothetical protein n=1 Tax=Psychrobacter sp. NPDC078501 TaxID=3364495 RepID=UPI0026143607|nr:hypothetical protein [uncultured Psychrobacter sp.]